MRPRTAVALLVVLTTLLALVAPYVRSYTRAATLIAGMTGIEGPVADVLAFERQDFLITDVVVPSRHGGLRARIYRSDHPRRAIVLVPGLHAIGVDEPRFYNLAMQFAQVGWTVLAPEMPDLAKFSVTARTTDMIEDAAVWLASQPRLARRGRIGIVGISFAGGLSLVAAGRPSLRDHLDFVFAFGGHANFPRVLRFLSSGRVPADLPPAGYVAAEGGAEVTLQPHDYGVAVLTLGLADRMVPPEQVEPLRAAILEYLTASCYDLINLTTAVAIYRSADAMADALPEPAQTIMRQVNARDVEALGPRIRTLLPKGGYDPALSADQSPATQARVFLLHGTGDNVVPAIETRFLGRYFEGRTDVRALLSGLITHAELNDESALSEAWNLLDFFADLLRQ